MYQEQLNKQTAPSHTPPGPASSHFGPSPSPSFWAPGIEGAKPSSLSPVIVEQHLMKTRPMPNAEMASQKPPMLPNPPTPNSSRSTPIRRLEARAAAMEEAANQIEAAAAMEWKAAAAEWEEAAAEREAVLEARTMELNQRAKRLADQEDLRQRLRQTDTPPREAPRGPPQGRPRERLSREQAPALAPRGSGATVYAEWRAANPPATLRPRHDAHASADVHQRAGRDASLEETLDAEADAEAEAEAAARFEREVSAPMSERSAAEVALWQEFDAARELARQEAGDEGEQAAAKRSGTSAARRKVGGPRFAVPVEEEAKVPSHASVGWARPDLSSRRMRLAELMRAEQQASATSSLSPASPATPYAHDHVRTLAAQAAAAAATAAHGASARTRVKTGGIAKPFSCAVQTSGLPVEESSQPGSASNTGSARLAAAAASFGDLERLAASEADKFRHCVSPSPVPTPESGAAAAYRDGDGGGSGADCDRGGAWRSAEASDRAASAGRIFADAVAISSEQTPARGAAFPPSSPAPSSPAPFSPSNRSLRAPSHTPPLRSRSLEWNFGGVDADSEAETPGRIGGWGGRSELPPPSQRSSHLSSRFLNDKDEAMATSPLTTSAAARMGRSTHTRPAGGTRAAAAAATAAAVAHSPGGLSQASSSLAGELERQAVAMEEAAAKMEAAAADEWKVAAREWGEAAAERQAALDARAADLKRATARRLLAGEPPNDLSVSDGHGVAASLLSWPDLSPSDRAIGADLAPAAAPARAPEGTGAAVYAKWAGRATNDHARCELDARQPSSPSWPSYAESVAAAEKAAEAAAAVVRATKARRAFAADAAVAVVPAVNETGAAQLPATTVVSVDDFVWPDVHLPAAPAAEPHHVASTSAYVPSPPPALATAAYYAQTAAASAAASAAARRYVSLSEQFHASEGGVGSTASANPRISLAELDLSGYDAPSLRDATTGDLRASVVKSRMK